MKFCTNCGSKVEETDVKCPTCGFVLKKDEDYSAIGMDDADYKELYQKLLQHKETLKAVYEVQKTEKPQPVKNKKEAVISHVEPRPVVVKEENDVVFDQTNTKKHGLAFALICFLAALGMIGTTFLSYSFGSIAIVGIAPLLNLIDFILRGFNLMFGGYLGSIADSYRSLNASGAAYVALNVLPFITAIMVVTMVLSAISFLFTSKGNPISKKVVVFFLSLTLILLLAELIIYLVLFSFGGFGLGIMLALADNIVLLVLAVTKIRPNEEE